MKCPKCGDIMECVIYSDDTGDYIHWVCYVCEAEIDDSYSGFHPERWEKED